MLYLFDVLTCLSLGAFLSSPTTTDYDDASMSGGSYGASLDDRDLSISPGTLAQFTWSAQSSGPRLISHGSSDDEACEVNGAASRRRLDSISEDDPPAGQMELDQLELTEQIGSLNPCKYKLLCCYPLKA